MPHKLGSANFSGIIEATSQCGQEDFVSQQCLDWLEISPGVFNCLAWQYTYRFYFCNGEYDEYFPLGIFEPRPVDFLLANMTINDYPTKAKLTHSATQVIPIGKKFTLNGTVFFEENRVSISDANPGFLRTMQLVKRASDNQFCIRFRTSNKYTGSVDIPTSYISISGKTQANVDMELFWGGFN